ncbi:WD domain, G-beta repeat-containing protein [Besnoitia besnoiti]|uniref:WD domain, G-beta repeat-containing protein n=1 Tax=Besnoitia besnoiti TaxID=94643 RepID=A0A2A9MHB1_BESBE|nr:WD domain, G-beta repeat-containing protein [Besnoitia besnoiti]PFH35043.1 WD domain, G-beta repeat-containing protein [Besnoitia besnoiti]
MPEFFASLPDQEEGKGPVRPERSSYPSKKKLHFPFQHRGTIRPHDAAVNFLCFSRDNNYLLAASSDKTVSLSNPHTGCHVATFRAGPTGGHDCVVTCVSSGFGNRSFLSTGSDGRAFLWDVESQQVTKTLPRHRAPLLSFARRRQRATASRTSGGTAAAASAAGSGLPTQTSRAATQPAASFFSHVVVLAGDDRVIRVYDIRMNNRHACVQEMHDAKDSVTGLLSTGDSLLACSADGCVYEYDIRQGRLYTDEVFQPITSFCLSRDGQSLLLSCSDGLLRLQERTTGEIVLGLSGHTHREQYRLEALFTLLDMSAAHSGGAHEQRTDAGGGRHVGASSRLGRPGVPLGADSDWDDLDACLGLTPRDDGRMPDYRMCVLSGSEDGALVGWDLQQAALAGVECPEAAAEWMVIRQQIHGDEEDAEEQGASRKKQGKCGAALSPYRGRARLPRYRSFGWPNKALAKTLNPSAMCS